MTDLDRRTFLKRSAITGTAAAGLGLVGLEAAAQPATAATAGTVNWGALCLPPALRASSAASRRSKPRSDAVRHHPLPDAVDLATREQVHVVERRTGHTQILSWFARTEAGLVSWEGIAQGNRTVDHQQARPRRGGLEGLLLLPQGARGRRHATDWKAAYRRVHQIFDNVGVTG